jgi:hypothetical protein
MKTIVTKRRHVILVSDEDYETVSKHKWYCCKSGRTRYASTVLHGGSIMTMHRMILNAPEGVLVDHKDRNGLNNQRENLRLCTSSENNRNKISLVGNNSYKGAAFHKASGLFHCTIAVNNRQISGGYFKTAIEAARKYDELAVLHHGEFALTNRRLGLL